MINRKHVKFRIFKHVEQLYDIFHCTRKRNVKFLKKYLITYIMLQCFFSKKNKFFYRNFLKFLNVFFLKKYSSLQRFLLFKIKLLRFFILSFSAPFLTALKATVLLDRSNFISQFFKLFSCFFKFKSPILIKFCVFFFKRFLFFFRSLKLSFHLRSIYSSIFLMYYRAIYYYFVIRYRIGHLFKIFRFLSRNLNKSVYNFIYQVVYNLIPDSFLSIQKKKRLYQFLLRNVRSFKYLYKYLFFILSSKKQFRMKNSFFLRKLNFKKSLILNFNINPSNYFHLFSDNKSRTIRFFFDSLNYKPDVYLIQLGWLSSFHSSLLKPCFFFINFSPLLNFYKMLQTGDVLSFDINLLKYILFRRRYNVFSLFKFVFFFLKNYVFKFSRKRRRFFSRYNKFYMSKNKRRFFFNRSLSFSYLLRRRLSHLLSSSSYRLRYYYFSSRSVLKKRVRFSPFYFRFPRFFGLFSNRKRKTKKIRKDSLYIRYTFKRSLFLKNPFGKFLRFFKYFLYRRFFRSFSSRSRAYSFSIWTSLFKSISSSLTSNIFFSRFFYNLSSSKFSFDHIFSNYRVVKSMFVNPFPIMQFPWIKSLHSFFHLKKLVSSFFNHYYFNYRYNYLVFIKRSYSLSNLFYYNTFNYLYNQNHIFHLLNYSKYKFNNLNNNLYLNYLFYKKHYKIRF